jgi:predicted RND superfamily exporter protein
MLERVAEVHDYLQGVPDVGKVLSLHTTLDVLKSLDDKHQLDDFFLALLYKKAPEDIKRALIYPYLSSDGDQVRFALRIHDANPALQRNSLLEAIESHLTEAMGYAPGQVHLTGMMVLYNNLLQSLFRSQILTLGAVFLAILVTFMVLFRSPLVAVIAIIPNLLAASMVLGLIGALGIPLDIMTITIAAITIGIGVDDTIHYIHRYHEEWRADHNYWLTVRRAHESIGRAMYYTSLIITVGFMVMVLSQFIPTVYFGLFTAFAMISALLANLTLLPMLLRLFKPYGPNQGSDIRLSIHNKMA